MTNNFGSPVPLFCRNSLIYTGSPNINNPQRKVSPTLSFEFSALIILNVSLPKYDNWHTLLGCHAIDRVSPIDKSQLATDFDSTKSEFV